MRHGAAVETASVSDTRIGPNPPSTLWYEEGELRGGIQSAGRAHPCTFPATLVVDAMRRHADATSPKDPWFFNEATGRRHVREVRAAADGLAEGRTAIVADQHPIGLSPVRLGLSLLEKEMRETVDMEEAMRIWNRDHDEDDHG